MQMSDTPTGDEAGARGWKTDDASQAGGQERLFNTRWRPLLVTKVVLLNSGYSCCLQAEMTGGRKSGLRHNFLFESRLLGETQGEL